MVASAAALPAFEVVMMSAPPAASSMVATKSIVTSAAPRSPSRRAGARPVSFGVSSFIGQTLSQPPGPPQYSLTYMLRSATSETSSTEVAGW